MTVPLSRGEQRSGLKKLDYAVHQGVAHQLFYILNLLSKIYNENFILQNGLNVPYNLQPHVCWSSLKQILKECFLHLTLFAMFSKEILSLRNKIFSFQRNSYKHPFIPQTHTLMSHFKHKFSCVESLQPLYTRYLQCRSS